MFLQLFRELLRHKLRLVLAAAAHGHAHQPRDRRVAQLLAKLNLLVVKPEVIVLPRVLNGRMKRRETLHDHFSLDVAAAGPTGHLHQQLKRPLTRAKVRQVQCHVRVNDPHQRHVREVQPFGDHLRADQDINLAHAERAEHFPVQRFLCHHVRVHPMHSTLWKRHLDRRLDLLRAHAGISNRRVAALRIRTNLRHAGNIAAQMTEQLLGFAVIGQRHGAVLALGHVTAFRTEQMRRVPAPIQKQDDLLFLSQPRLDGIPQFARQHVQPLGANRFLPHVHNAHQRHFLVIDPLRQRRQRVAAALGVVK